MIGKNWKEKEKKARRKLRVSALSSPQSDSAVFSLISLKNSLTKKRL